MNANAIQSAIMWAALAGLGACLAAVALAWLFSAAAAYVRRVRRCSRLAQIGLVASTVALLLFGGDKPTPHLWRFDYVNAGDYGVHDNGSICTNDEIRAAWTYDLPVQSYTMHAAYQDLTITNALGECTDELHVLATVPVSDGAHTWTVEDAENMRVVLYADYVAPPSVHTNGVYEQRGVMRAMETDEAKYVTPGVPILADLSDGSQIEITPTNAPPTTSRSLLTTIQETDE